MALTAASQKRAFVRIVWGCAIAVSLVSPAVATDALPPRGAQAAAPSELTYIGERQISPRLREITLMTPAVVTPSLGPMPGNPTGQTKVRVLLPKDYDPAGTRRYPVLYLYHGGGGSEAEWTTPATKGKAEELTEDLPLIVVMPDGGVASGYADWYNGGAFGAPRWKTYHLDQLIPWVDANFRTVAHRTGRATAGLSMGGGGLRYAAQRPDLIGATAAFSGDIDILQPASDWNGMGAFVSRMIWGDRKTEEVRWRGVNGVDLAQNLVNTDVAIFTGDTGHPEGTYIMQGSTAVHDRLNALRIPHEFKLYPGMTHRWPTWNRALSEWLPRLMSRFAATQLADARKPQAFSYSTIDPTYEVFGWRVKIDRNALEFSTLEVTDTHRFDVVGSGVSVVETPVVAKPHAALRATLWHDGSAGKTRTIRLRADQHGRVSVPVELGQTNPFQQYSPQADAAATGRKPADTAFRQFNDGSRFFRVHVRLSPE